MLTQHFTLQWKVSNCKFYYIFTINKGIPSTNIVDCIKRLLSTIKAVTGLTNVLVLANIPILISVNVVLSISRNASSSSSLWFRTLLDAFFVVRNGGSTVGTWLKGMSFQTDGGFVRRNFRYRFSFETRWMTRPVVENAMNVR